MESADLLLTLVTGVEALRQFLSNPEADEHDNVENPETLRNLMPSKYRRDLQPRVPERPEVNQRSALLLCRLVLAVDQLPGGFLGIPIGTKLLMGALCGPFRNPNGHPAPRLAGQPFMVWEHRQLYRLATGPLLHQNLAHLTSNLGSLAQSGSRLEATVGLPAFAALTASLTLSASALEVLYSRTAYKRFDDWRGYFCTTSVGASGLAFAMKVVDDHNRSGFLRIVQVATIPVQFSCWPQLLLSQILLPESNVSFSGHLCGIVAGLLHVFLPKADACGSYLLCELHPHAMGADCTAEDVRTQAPASVIRFTLVFVQVSPVKQLHQARKQQENQRCKQQQQQNQSWLHRILADDPNTQPSNRVFQEDASWSDLWVHALCAVASLGGHQLLRLLQRRLRRRGDRVHRHGGRSSSRQQSSFVGAPRFASNAAQPPSRSRRSSNTGRFL